MAKSIRENAASILSTLATQTPDSSGRIEIPGPKLKELTKLTPVEINDAVKILEESGYVELFTYI